MKRSSFLLLLLVIFLLNGCVFPLKRVSPDPLPESSSFPARQDRNLQSVPTPSDSTEAAVSDAPLRSVPSHEPKLAVFWYAMADARVYELRQQLTPALTSAGIPFREYDAENDRYRQLDQIREAVRSGWNLLAVQLVSDGSSEDARAIIEAVEGCPLVFFDRTPDPEQFGDDFRQAGTVGLICTSPKAIGIVQGRMIGRCLTERFTDVDLNQDGRISYTMLIGNPDDSAALAQCHAAISEADSALVHAGYAPLAFYDPENALCYQADPGRSGASEAAAALMLADLETHNYANSNTIELVVACNDDMALGALTALQSAWCNLGDGRSVTVPLFGSGASAAARTAVQLGQMSGTVEENPAAFANAVLACVGGLAEGHRPAELFAELSGSSDDYAVSSDAPNMLFILPSPVVN